MILLAAGAGACLRAWTATRARKELDTIEARPMYVAATEWEASAWKHYQWGTITINIYYMSSIKLLHAERAIALNENAKINAFTNHKNRMNRLKEYVRTRMLETDSNTANEPEAAYYLEEANYWLQRANRGS
jgi:hypothetical protein